MKYKDYSPTIWQNIKSVTQLAKQECARPVAAFDADGTIWDVDLGENFFDFLIEHKLVSLPDNPWEHYQNLKTQDRPRAYLWLAQICKGQPFQKIQGWAQQAIQEIHPVPIFEAQRKLIDYFLEQKIQVYIVTASVKWAVEAAAPLLGLTAENVIGIETNIENEIVTDKQKGEISFREGKVKALLERTGQKNAFFATGNTEGDLELLESATHLRLAVSATRRDDRLFRTESRLARYAHEKGWLTHRFVEDEA